MTAESNASTDSEPINLDEACEMFGGDPALIRSIVEAFLMETPGLMKTLNASYQAGDAKSVMRAVHTMKSNFNNLCLTNDSNLCREIEDLAKNNDLAAIEDHVGRLRERVQTVVRQLNEYLSS